MDAELAGAAQQAQQAARRVLIGHSMGGAAAAEAVISNPAGVAALVLVAPAVVAMWLGPPEQASGDPVATGACRSACCAVPCCGRPRRPLQAAAAPRGVLAVVLMPPPFSALSSPAGLAVVEELVSSEDAPGELSSLPPSPSTAGLGGGGAAPSAGARVRRVVRTAAALLKAVWFLACRALLAAAGPLLVLVLRRLVRSRRFWERGLASAWHDGSRITRQYVDAYR